MPLYPCPIDGRGHDLGHPSPCMTPILSSIEIGAIVLGDLPSIGLGAHHWPPATADMAMEIALIAIRIRSVERGGIGQAMTTKQLVRDRFQDGQTRILWNVMRQLDDDIYIGFRVSPALALGQFENVRAHEDFVKITAHVAEEYRPVQGIEFAMFHVGHIDDPAPRDAEGMPLRAIVIDHHHDRASTLPVENGRLVGGQRNDGFGRYLSRFSAVFFAVVRLDSDPDFLRRKAPFDPVELALNRLVNTRLKPVVAQDRGHPAPLVAARRDGISAVDGDVLQRCPGQRDDGPVKHIGIGARDAIALLSCRWCGGPFRLAHAKQFLSLRPPHLLSVLLDCLNPATQCVTILQQHGLAYGYT